MFQGIVLGLGTVRAARDGGGARRLQIDLGDVLAAAGRELPGNGASIAINGACLTAVEQDGAVVRFDVVAETLRRTDLGQVAAGDPVNVELALAWGAEIDGHLVLGHVDGTAAITSQSRCGDDVRMRFRLAPEHMAYVVEKGSVALDGISLTVAGVDRGAGEIEVALIPYTLSVTTLGRKATGALVNVELDHQSKLAAQAVAPTLAAIRASLDQLADQVDRLADRVVALEARA